MLKINCKFIKNIAKILHILNKFNYICIKIYKNNKDGFYVHAKNEIKSAKIAAKYIGRYVGRPAIAESRILKYDGKFPLMKEIDKYTDDNRSIGIEIGCYDSQVHKLKYPLKLVSPTYKGSYEDLDKPSYGDPDQGFGQRKRRKTNENFNNKM